MYCSVCKLRVADDSVVICPVCQGALQPESEAGENPEADGFVDELAAVFEQGPEPDIKFEDKLDAYVRDDTNLDFDPEVLGLKSTEEDEPEASAEDIKVLADLWEKEDIGADLDGVFAEAFNLEEVAPESPVVDQGSMKPEKVAPESPVMPIPEISTPAPVENSRNLGFPLLIFIVLLAAGGSGWFYMHNAGVKPENKLIREIKSPTPAPVNPQARPQLEPVVANDKPIEGKVVPVVAGSTLAVVKPQLVGDEAAEIPVVDKRGSLSDVETAVPVPAVADPDETVAVAAGSAVTTSELPVQQPEAESQLATASAPSSEVEKKTQSVTETAVENPKSETPAAEKVTPESIPAKEKAVAAPEKANRVAAPEVTATGPCYVVHVGSFRNEAGADRQIAKLQKKGFAAYKVKVDLGAKGVWQRIFVPGGVSKSAARQVQEQLAKSFPREESLLRKIKK